MSLKQGNEVTLAKVVVLLLNKGTVYQVCFKEKCSDSSLFVSSRIPCEEVY